MNKSGTTNTEKRGNRIRGNANPNLVSHCSYGGGMKISTGAKDFSGVSPAAKRRKRRRGRRSSAASEMRMGKTKARWKMICRGGWTAIYIGGTALTDLAYPTAEITRLSVFNGRILWRKSRGIPTFRKRSTSSSETKLIERERQLR